MITVASDGIRPTGACEFIDHEFLVETSCREELRLHLTGKCDRADDMRMLDSVEAFARVRVPHLSVSARQCMFSTLTENLSHTLRSPPMLLLRDLHRSKGGLASRRLCGR